MCAQPVSLIEHTISHCFYSVTADVDYVSVVQNLTFNAETGRRTFSVSIIDDTLAEDDEIFEVILKPIPNSSFNVMIGEPSVATGIIFDDDIPSKTYCNLLPTYFLLHVVCTSV